MNITTIKVCSPGQLAFTTTTHFSFALTEQDRSSPYILRKATGLDPSELIRTYNDGPKFFRVRPKERVVSFQVKLNPNYQGSETMGDLRDELYKLIAYNTKANNWNNDTKLQLQFWNGETYIASLFGFMSQFDTDIFSNTSDVVFSIECEDPFLRSVNNTSLNENIQLESTASHTYFNGITYGVESSFSCTDNKSTAPHGFQMLVEVISPIPATEIDPPKFIIWDSRSPLFYIFAITAYVEVGDRIWFSSEEDARFILHADYEGGIQVSVKSLMHRIYWGSIWPMIAPGENFFEVSEGFKIIDVYHRESYWGI